MSARILVGDALEQLRTLPSESVQCCVTSPPYWGLRDYGVAGQIGLERTPEEYVAKLVAVFGEVRRVLANDGTLWLNLGDSYATGGGKVGDCPGGGEQGERRAGRDHHPSRVQKGTGLQLGPMTQPNRMPLPGLKPKDLVGVPWRVAFALQADGWYLRSDIIWHKPNPMPESVTDRPTKAHEYLFLLAKSERYYYDAAAIAEACSNETLADPRAADEEYEAGRSARGVPDHQPSRGGGMLKPRRSGNKERKYGDDRDQPGSHLGASIPWEGDTRNRRTIWTVATQPYSGAHFATFPPALIEPCILAGSRRGDTVLDPFGGAGTTALVSDRLGRDSISIELNPAYAQLARERLTADAPLFVEVSA